MAVCNQLINLLTLVLIGTLPITSVRSAAVLMAPASRTLANITVTKVVTATQATTTTQSAVLTCTTLAAPLAITAIPPCRRKKQLRGLPVVAFDYNTVAGEDIDQFHSLNPTHVLKVEPSAELQVPEESLGDEGEVRARVWVVPSIVGRPAVEVIESSLDADGIRSSAEDIRSSHLADPRLFSALLSSLLSGWPFPTIPVVTVTRTVYTATSTATLFTSTSVHTLSGPAWCLPADFVACPSWEIEEEEAPTPSTTSTDDPDIPSTDVL